MWPLNYYFFNEWHLRTCLKEEVACCFGIAMIHYLSYSNLFLWKRWYCSWVCGCGGLAETAGDSFRHQTKPETRGKLNVG
jgi:hypothetical protein